MPIVPPAPGRFSTMTGWPHAALSRSPISRATTSVALPAVNGTMMRMARDGYASCPCAATCQNTAADASSALISFIYPPSTLVQPEKSHRRLVQALVAGFVNEHQLPYLYTGACISCHHVRLQHDRHARTDLHVGHRARRPARAAQDRRQIAADEAMHQVVACREAALLDDASCFDQRRHRRACLDDFQHLGERGLSRGMQVAVERIRFGADAKGAQHLPGIFPKLCADLAEEHVAFAQASGRWELRGQAALGRCHRRGTEIVDPCRAARPDIRVFANAPKLALVDSGFDIAAN